MIKLITLSSKDSMLKMEKILKNEDLNVVIHPQTGSNSTLIFWEESASPPKSNYNKSLSKAESIENTETRSFPQKIVGSKENKNFLLDVSTILYFFTDGNELAIVTEDASKYIVNHSLQFWEKRLSVKKFFRCQKGYLVNIEKVSEIIPYFNSTLGLKFKVQKNIVPVGRKYLKDFKDAIAW